MLSASPLTRLPNTTLQLPQTPQTFGFKLAPITNSGGTALMFNLPVGFASPPDETNRLFIIEKTNAIAVITNLAAPTRSIFLDLGTNKLSSQSGQGEGGVLGLAFHPGYATNGYFYVYYLGTNSTAVTAGTNKPHNTLSRFSVDPANTNRALPGSEVKLISQYDTIGSHNAGDLHFGPDGYLYVSLGDEGSGGNVIGDPRTNSQHIAKNFFSAIMRLDVDKRAGNLAPNPHPSVITNGSGQAGYAVPLDNPYVHTSLGGDWNGVFNNSNYSAFLPNVRSEFYAVGFRNPWRFTFDPLTGRLLVGDVGLKDREEIDDVIRGGNYGWAFREGTTNGTRYLEAPPGFTSIPPIFEYGHVATNTFNWPPQFGPNLGGTVIGGVFYRGDRLSQLYGYYVFGDYDYGIIEPAGQPMWAFKYDGTNISNFQTLMTNKQIAAYGIDPANGDVLLACLTNVATAGAGAGFNSIFRLVYNTNSAAGTPPPATLADAGVFSDLYTLTPQPGVVPYSLNVPFWSDNAIKSRWFSVPNTNLTLGFDASYNWSFPTGTVWIKHFELELTNGVPTSRKRLETRLLIRNDTGVHGLTYRWGNSISNATLVEEAGFDENFVINDGGTLRTQTWHYPSRAQCQQCHLAIGGFALGFNTAQLNRDYDYGSGTVTNQLKALSDAGYFTAAVSNYHTLRTLAAATNTAVSLEYRTRSYLAANCRQCHQGPVNYAAWDANITTPTALAGLVDATPVDNLGDPNNRVVKTGSLTNSVLFSRIAKFDNNHMPPLATLLLDAQNVALVAAWITNSLPSYQTFAQWQANYAWANSGDADADADPDLDGAVNYLEYLTTTDPQNGTNFWQIGIQLAGSNVGITFPQIAGRGFEVQSADSLITPVWTPLDSPANAPFFSASNFVNTIWDSAAGNNSRYYRVRVFEP